MNDKMLRRIILEEIRNVLMKEEAPAASLDTCIGPKGSIKATITNFFKQTGENPQRWCWSFLMPNTSKSIYLPLMKQLDETGCKGIAASYADPDADRFKSLPFYYYTKGTGIKCSTDSRWMDAFQSLKKLKERAAYMNKKVPNGLDDPTQDPYLDDFVEYPGGFQKVAPPK